jgi:pimeloyl-ACP methyl ester carboxylesterase
MKRLALFLIALSIFSLACKAFYNLQNPTDAPREVPPQPTMEVSRTSEPGEISATPTQPPFLISNMEDKLKELGGEPCEIGGGFTCVTLKVPLDHFDPTNAETIEVVFAVAPARGERKGMYVQAFPGGPGGEGISVASTFYFPDDVVDGYDIVFFDQRGLGLSSPLSCENAYASYFLDYLNFNDTIGQEGYDTPEEQRTAVQKAKSFVDNCVKQIGIDPAKLKFYVTDQVAEDIDAFRQAIGDDKFMLYGVSYGTSVAQTYARAHSDRLMGLIIDGVQDTTLTGDQIAFSQDNGFNEVLLAVFKACDADFQCSQGMPDGSQAAYDELAQKLADAPIAYEYPLSNGTKAKRLFTFNMLDWTASYQLYGIDSRMELMRALASAKAGDMIPMATLLYGSASIDPETGEYVGDPNFSYTIYYTVWCGDDAYYSGTSEERGAKLLREGQKLIGLIPRLDLDVFTTGLACAYWPGAPTSPEIVEPLRAEDVPTFVLNSTADPTTPFHEGKSVFEHLANGYHIYVEGGGHSIYGWGYNCPDQHINDFLMDGTLPEQRVIVCNWGNPVISP